MARKRMIDPTIWEDPSFNKLSLQARLIFIGMISNADDEGYLRGDAGSIKRLVLGFDDVTKDQMTSWLGELQSIKSMHFFEYEGEEYVHFTNWFTYQRQREDRILPSVYPKCSRCQTSVRQVTDNSQTDDGQLPAEVKLSKGKISKGKISKEYKEYIEGGIRGGKSKIANNEKKASPFQAFSKACISFIDLFNQLFGTSYQPTRGRQEKLRLRMKTYSHDQIRTALTNLSKSSFHTGKNERGWVATPDFILQSDEQIDKWLNVTNGKKGPRGGEIERILQDL